MRWLGALVALGGCVLGELDEPPVASTAAAVTTCTTGTWCTEPAPAAVAAAGTLLHGVWAASDTDVFAVGDGGVILRRVSGAWTQLASGTTANLRAVWGTSGADVWAGGVSGALVHWNGSTWSRVTGITTNIDAIWGSGPTDVWFAGSGVITRWNGATYTATGFGGSLLSISGTGPLDVWTTGESTNLHHYTGTWSTVAPPGAGTTTFFSVLALSTSEVWVSDLSLGKETMHWVGGKWVSVTTGGAIWNGMSALSPTDLWGAGGSRIGRGTGTAWTTSQPFGSAASLWAIATRSGHAWVVGSGALIGHFAL